MAYKGKYNVYRNTLTKQQVRELINCFHLGDKISKAIMMFFTTEYSRPYICKECGVTKQHLSQTIARLVNSTAYKWVKENVK